MQTTKDSIIKITNIDFARLLKLIMNERDHNTSNIYNLQKLYEELKKAEKVEPERIEPDVVTMNSIIQFIDLEDKKSKQIKLVYPKDADISKNYISILAPVGIALLGYRKGDMVEWNVPAGRRKYLIEDIIYQPEANGEYLI